MFSLQVKRAFLLKLNTEQFRTTAGLAFGAQTSQRETFGARRDGGGRFLCVRWALEVRLGLAQKGWWAVFRNKIMHLWWLFKVTHSNQMPTQFTQREAESETMTALPVAYFQSKHIVTHGHIGSGATDYEKCLKFGLESKGGIFATVEQDTQIHIV